MSFFEAYFSDVTFKASGETAVCCPFPHHDLSGNVYQESVPSAHINLDKEIFHCKVCDVGLSEVGFISRVLDLTYHQAFELKRLLKQSRETRMDWQPVRQHLNPQYLTQFQIHPKVAEECQLGGEGDGLAVPVFIYDKLVDVRTYNPGGKPKVRSRKHAPTGMIIPFDVWRYSDPNRWTVICAGEKDMLVARSHGLNAITITGGEKAIPTYWLKQFKDKKVAICYDHDEAGILGANKLAMHLKPYAQCVRVVTAFHEVCVGKGEDITDFFLTYQQPVSKLQEYILHTPDFSEEDYQREKEKEVPTVPLLQASQPKYAGKKLRTNIQVLATFENQFLIPSTITATKTKIDESKPAANLLNVGDSRSWSLDENCIGDILYLCDSQLKENAIEEYKKKLLQLPKGEAGISISEPSKETIFKCMVSDAFESNARDAQHIEFLAYSINKKLENGKKYKITYKLVPHPFDGQKLTMMILDTEEANDSVSNFQINDDVKRQLSQFQKFEGESLNQAIHRHVEKVKGLVKYDANETLIQLIDLWFHTPLEFNMGNLKNQRAYLDTIIVGESRTGKSSISTALQEAYGLGTFVSLAGNSATIPGLVGGSSKAGGSWQVRAGMIPQNHRGAIIFEELAKSKGDILKELTDIKSSNEVRITRVNGTLQLPALVRMLTLTNPKVGGGGMSKPISSYPNGISVIADLVGTAEDIARFDLIAVLGDKGNLTIDPFWTPQDPYPIEDLRTKLRWIWSRQPDQIMISPEVYRHLVDVSNSLNKEFESYIKIFGTETWKKLIRLSIAVAAYVCSTDDSFTNIIIDQEHINYARNLMVSLYDNETFRFKEYVAEELSYKQLDDASVSNLQDLFIQNPTVLLHLETSSETTRNNLQAISGLEPKEFTVYVNRLVANKFVRFMKHEIVPTEKFRKGMKQINRTIRVPRVGETIA